MKCNRGKRLSNAAFAALWNDLDRSLNSIANELGITDAAVISRAKTRGLPPRAHRHFPAHAKLLDCPMLPRLWAKNVSRRDILSYYGLTPEHSSTLTRYTRKRKLPKRKCTKHNAKPLLAALMELQREDALKQRND